MAATVARRLLQPSSAASISNTTRLLPSTAAPPPHRNSDTNSPVSFEWSDNDADNPMIPPPPLMTKNPELPPPYDPFSKKTVLIKSSDPTNLQEIFHRMRTKGLTHYTIKLFDGLSKDKGAMPDVVALTVVLEAYVSAGSAHWCDTVHTYDRMLASGVKPNAYTLSILTKGLATSDRCSEAGGYLLEMLNRGMWPNVVMYLAAFEAYVRLEKVELGEVLLETMKGKGFMPDKEAVRSGTMKRGMCSEVS